MEESLDIIIKMLEEVSNQLSIAYFEHYEGILTDLHNNLMMLVAENADLRSQLDYYENDEYTKEEPKVNFPWDSIYVVHVDEDEE